MKMKPLPDLSSLKPKVPTPMNGFSYLSLRTFP